MALNIPYRCAMISISLFTIIVCVAYNSIRKMHLHQMNGDYLDEKKNWLSKDCI